VVTSTPKKCGCADYYHSLHTAEGRDDESIERSFHRNENNLPSLFKAVRNRQVPSEQDWWTLFWMVALHMVRVPKSQKAYGRCMSDVSAKQVKTLNYRVISGGYRYVYGPSDDAVIREWAALIAEARSKSKPSP
jgi:hypothetical protein